jgi:hypothetical protein
MAYIFIKKMIIFYYKYLFTIIMSYQQFIDSVYTNNLTTLKNMCQSDPNIINEVNTNSATLLADLIYMNLDLMNPSTEINYFNSDHIIIDTFILVFLIKSGINLPKSMNLLFDYSRMFGSTFNMNTAIYERMLEDQKQYYENLLKEKLQEQKEQLLEEIYAPNGIGYQAAKERFETQ